VSCEDFKGSAHAFREFMRREQDAIERGERVGVSVKWATADPRRTVIGWLPPQWLRGLAPGGIVATNDRPVRPELERFAKEPVGARR
jgi:hypothetical protein